MNIGACVAGFDRVAVENQLPHYDSSDYHSTWSNDLRVRQLLSLFRWPGDKGIDTCVAGFSQAAVENQLPHCESSDYHYARQIPSSTVATQFDSLTRR